MFRIHLPACLICLAALASAGEVTPSPKPQDVDALIDQAQRFLLAQAQPSGAFVPGAKFSIGMTGLVVEALARQPQAIAVDDLRMAKALSYIDGFRQPDGGVYDPAEGLGNYNTSIALLAWARTGAGETAAITAAQNYLFSIQNTQPDSPSRGGMGYARSSQGPGWEDLSNTSWAIEALRASGVPASDPRMQAAIGFLERCQDLSAVNALPWVRNSGGAVYAPHESQAGGSWNRQPVAAGAAAPRLEAYGSMTYALISSYVALNIGPTDPRVQAALGWIRAHWTTERNPGMTNTPAKPTADQQGLFNYYRVASKTFDLLRIGSLDLPDGLRIDPHAELYAALVRRVRRDGDQAWWANDQDRWAEGTPALATAYAVQNLKIIRQRLP